MNYLITNNQLSRFVSWLLINLLLLIATSSSVLAADYIDLTAKPGHFVINQNDTATPLFIDSDEPEGLKIALKNLQKDLERVTGEAPQISSQFKPSDFLVIVGTLQNSELLRQLEQAGRADFSAIKKQWEGFQIELINDPFDGVKQALVVAGSDMRGAIFGVYDIAENIGVSPWNWWADVPVKQHESLYVKANTRKLDWPRVKYRGIFLNDEAPALTGWVKEKYGNYNSQFYARVFELLLRLKANFLWPAMWNNAFSLDDEKNPQLADRMGIVMSTSHHEPMMRADKEWNWTGKGKWDYSVNSDNLYKFWLEGAKRHKDLESVFTLGMRGQQDEPMSENQNITLLERIVSDQRKILKQVYAKDDISDVPQVWALYKEVQGYYENGMRVPDDVTLLWSDDNWGNIRRLPTAEERRRVGGAGVYYHFDYVGGPRSYRWINTVPIAKIWEQMHLAYQYHARKIWITNVGDLKPMELPMDFFLSMAWDPEKFCPDNLTGYLEQFAGQQFGQQYARQIAGILHGYTKHNGRRKPESVGPDTYSQLDYQEAQRISEELNGYVLEAERLYKLLQPNQRAAFFQLVLHPVKASQIVFEINNNLAKNRLYASQQRVSANDYAQKVKYWFTQDANLKEQYHSLNNGKWNHFMDQPHLGYSNWNNPPADVMPVLHINHPNDVADMGVAIEGSAYAWPQASSSVWPHSTDMTLRFDPHGQQQRYIDIFNKGTLPFDFTLDTSADWIKVSQSQGNIENELRVWISVNWDKLGSGTYQGDVTITGAAWGKAQIRIVAESQQQTTARGFVEADGYVSIEAASAHKIKNQQDAYWAEIPMHGRTHSSLSVFMPVDKNFADDLHRAPYLEYDLFLFSTGKFTLNSYLAPSQNFIGEQGLRFAVAIDEQPAQIVNLSDGYNHGVWQQSVEDGVRKVQLPIEIAEKGAHKVRIYAIDPGIVLQKIVIDTGGLKPSYLGPPQSPLAF